MEGLANQGAEVSLVLGRGSDNRLVPSPDITSFSLLTKLSVLSVNMSTGQMSGLDDIHGDDELAHICTCLDFMCARGLYFGACGVGSA